jgi:hypothetical protein
MPRNEHIPSSAQIYAWIEEVFSHGVRRPGYPADRLATWQYDPSGSLAGATQILPFGREFQAAMEPVIAAGAKGFVGVLRDYPGNACEYYVPYDAIARPIPGVWVRGSDGARLGAHVAAGRARVRLAVDGCDVRRLVDEPRTG